MSHLKMYTAQQVNGYHVLNNNQQKERNPERETIDVESLRFLPFSHKHENLKSVY